MKLIPILLCAAAFILLPACASKAPEKTSCCSAKGKCDAPAKKHHH